MKERKTQQLYNGHECQYTIVLTADSCEQQYVSILYCRLTERVPGGKGFEGAACAAGSDYHVLVPSKGRARAIGLGCSPLHATAGGPHQGAHPLRADRPGRALRGARAGWHVGGDPGLPPLGPELRAGLHQPPSSLSLARGGRRGLVLDGIVNIGGLISHLF